MMKKNEKIAGGAALLSIGVIALIIGFVSNKSNKEQYADIFEAQGQYDMNYSQNGSKNSVENENNQSDYGTSQNQQDSNASETQVQDNTIVVDIKGAVKNPREYSMNEGSRVRDLIEKAGGLTEEADEERIYYSKLLEDEECIRIYKIGECENGSEECGESTEGSGDKSSGKININKADLAELETLPGIGAVKAQSIINYRQANGKFSSVDELTNVDGIGEKTVAKLKDMADVK